MSYNFNLFYAAGRFAFNYLKKNPKYINSPIDQDEWDQHVKYAILFLQSEYVQENKYFTKFISRIPDKNKDVIRDLNTFDNFLLIPVPKQDKKSKGNK